ncbi:MAG: FAD-binding and (Fe-S)-binding domain-containing protein [Rhodomicrobium sp.]
MQRTDYAALAHSLETAIPKARMTTDYLRRLSYGTDASFYRLIPEIVLTVENEAEVAAAITACAKAGAPVTFRAAGTSLSGQAITDSVLIVLGDGWQGFRISEGGLEIALQPGVIGAEANRRLAPHGRKIGPDPASIGAAMIGGIAANNASGMCCGTAQNSYKTVVSMRVVLADGTVLDMGSAESRAVSFLVNIANFKPARVALKATATYHDSCAGLRELGIFKEPRSLLAEVHGLELKPLPGNDVCCGFGGTFCVKYPAISNAIVGEKARAVDGTGADLLLGGDLGCLMNMAGKLSREGSKVRVMHAAEVLAAMADRAIGEED